MSRKFLVFALVLPLAVVVIGIVRAEHHLAYSRPWVFDVNGYDPRDLLRGHYIQFRVDLHEGSSIEPCDEEQGEDCCMCLTPTADGEPPTVQRATCSYATTQCEGALQVRSIPELTRFYIPEEEAPELERKFQDAARDSRSRIEVAIDAAGQPQIRSLLIDGEEVAGEAAP